MQLNLSTNICMYVKAHKNGQLESRLLNHTKNRTSGYTLSNTGLYLRAAAQYVLLFLVLAVNYDWFQILQSYTLLLKPPILMHVCSEALLLVLCKVGFHVFPIHFVLKQHC